MTPDELQQKTASNPVLSQITELKECDVMNVLNGAYIARRFFDKSRSWFSKKINHNLNNGRPDDFTPEERKKLANALRTISFELDELADTLD